MKPIRKDLGFTLLELMVVMTIIGILTAISLPRYNEYKARGFDTRARYDLHHVALAEEAYFLDYEAYHSCSNQACKNLPGIAALSAGVTLSVQATPTGFRGTASHQKGSGQVFIYDSSAGGFQN